MSDNSNGDLDRSAARDKAACPTPRRDTVDQVLRLLSKRCRQEVRRPGWGSARSHCSTQVEAALDHRAELSIDCKQDIQTVLSGYDQVRLRVLLATLRPLRSLECTTRCPSCQPKPASSDTKLQFPSRLSSSPCSFSSSGYADAESTSPPTGAGRSSGDSGLLQLLSTPRGRRPTRRKPQSR